MPQGKKMDGPEDAVEAALARLMAGVEEEPVSDRLRQLARQLADALARGEPQPPPASKPDEGAASR